MAQGGWVVSVGPGIPVPDWSDDEGEPDTWDRHPPRARFLPLQAQEGDYVLFVRKSAVEITFEGAQYLIVPNSAVLVLVREDWMEGRGRWPTRTEGAADAGPKAKSLTPDLPAGQDFSRSPSIISPPQRSTTERPMTTTGSARLRSGGGTADTVPVGGARFP
ncbi:MAG: co-chaperone GroES [bacterium]|nr:co-chaperone GroES [bacterium]